MLYIINHSLIQTTGGKDFSLPPVAKFIIIINYSVI